MQTFKTFLSEEQIDEARNVTPKRVVSEINKVKTAVDKLEAVVEDYENSDATLEGKNPEVDSKLWKKIGKLSKDAEDIQTQLTKQLK